MERVQLRTSGQKQLAFYYRESRAAECGRSAMGGASQLNFINIKGKDDGSDFQL